MDEEAVKPDLPVLNISAYLFTALIDSAALRDACLAQAKALALKGTILIAEEGINLFLAGPEEEVRSFCLLYTSPSPRDRTRSRMPSSA